MSKIKQPFDCYPDGDGDVVILSDGFNEYDEPVLVHNHISLTRAKEVYLSLGEAIGVNPLQVLKDIRRIEIDHYMEHGAFRHSNEMRNNIQKILTIFEQ